MDGMRWKVRMGGGGSIEGVEIAKVVNLTSIRATSK
jgi:hypothetical protein